MVPDGSESDSESENESREELYAYTAKVPNDPDSIPKNMVKDIIKYGGAGLTSLGLLGLAVKYGGGKNVPDIDIMPFDTSNGYMEASEYTLEASSALASNVDKVDDALQLFGGLF